jgi:formylglycine-generating enzyme
MGPVMRSFAPGFADWYDSTYYTKGPDRNPKGPDHGTSKAFRGGAW